MIKTRDDLQDCLDKDKRALGVKKSRPSIIGDEVWKFEIALRMDLQKKNSQNWKRQRKCQSRLMRIALKPHLSGRLNLEELIRRVTEWMPMEHNHNQEKNV